MKKSMTLLLFALMAFVFSSCGEYTQTYYDQEVIQLDLTADRWTKHSSETMPVYYSASFDVPELTSYNFRTAVVSCELVYTDSRQPLPVTTHHMNGLGEMWTRTVDFQYGLGYVSIYVTSSDFYDEVPEKMYFRLSILCAQ